MTPKQIGAAVRKARCQRSIVGLDAVQCFSFFG